MARESVALKKITRNVVHCFMTLTILLVAAVLGTIAGAKPIYFQNRAEAQRTAHERYRCHQLRWVRRAHPELQGLSYREILRRYDLDDSYARISLRRD